MLITLSPLIVGLMLLSIIRPTGVSVKCVCSIIKAPPAVIGIVIVEWALHLPELLLQPTRAIHNFTEIAIGTAIGSSLTNLLLIAGIGAMIYPMNINLRY